MALSGSARTMKYKLKRQGLDETQIAKYLLDHGYLAQSDAPRPSAKVHTPNPAIIPPPQADEGLTASQPGGYADITEDTWKFCLLRLVNEAPQMTPQIIDKIRDYLDMKDKISKPPRALLPPAESDLIGFSG
jgi:hypothetical protein